MCYIIDGGPNRTMCGAEDETLGPGARGSESEPPAVPLVVRVREDS